jgi:hypothetical protein
LNSDLHVYSKPIKGMGQGTRWVLTWEKSEERNLMQVYL